MLTYVIGDLFTSPAQVLTNTVNTVGVMGKGIAKEFKRIYPEMFARYRELCERDQLGIGNLWLYRTPNKWILNFPTKKHWRHPSRPEYIEAGLRTFVNFYSKFRIHSIAFPALGCGNGELDFETQTKPLMERYLGKLPIYVFIYPPCGADPYPPEHRTPEEIKEWLRSEPETLSFREVWDDLIAIIAKEQSFVTPRNRSPFSVSLDAKSSRIKIRTKSRTQTFSYDQLLDFWQQLRRYGFSLARIAPNGLERYMPYLVPIFAKLDYIKPVILTDNYKNIDSNPSIGLQYMPFKNGPKERSKPTIL